MERQVGLTLLFLWHWCQLFRYQEFLHKLNNTPRKEETIYIFSMDVTAKGTSSMTPLEPDSEELVS